MDYNGSSVTPESVSCPDSEPFEAGVLWSCNLINKPFCSSLGRLLCFLFPVSQVLWNVSNDVHLGLASWLEQGKALLSSLMTVKDELLICKGINIGGLLSLLPPGFSIVLPM